MKATGVFASFLASLMLAGASHAVVIPTVLVGDPHNPPDSRYGSVLYPEGGGSVPYAFRMGKTEITNTQYIAFLNAVAASDPYGLYDTNMVSSTQGGITRHGLAGGYTYDVRSTANGTYTYADKPAVHIDWFDALRFANWLDNGQGGPDTTEDGAYTLLGGTPVPSNAESITRNADARWWIPNDNEWYKAAYYDADGGGGVYYDYPTGTDDVPNNKRPDFDNGNSANFFTTFYTTGNSDYPLTDADSYELSASPYGTLQQGGNAWEWTETYFGSNRIIRGGGYQNTSNILKPNQAGISTPWITNGSVGFRVATIPEPSTLVLTMLACGLLVLPGRRI